MAVKAAIDFDRLQRKQLAQALAKSITTIDNWVTAGCPRNEDGTFSLRAVVDWLLQRSAEGDTDLDLTAERARLAKWQADKTEQEVELRGGRMLVAEDVADWVAGMLATVTSRLVQVPDAVSQLVEPQHATGVAEAVRRSVYEALEDLSSNSRDLPRRRLESA